MSSKVSMNVPNRDSLSDMLLAICVGFLLNLVFSITVPEAGAFVAGIVAGVLVKNGPVRGAIAGFLAGTLGGLASIALWVMTNIVSMPGPLLPVAFQTAVSLLTAATSILSLSGGIIGGVVGLQHWPRITQFFNAHKIGIPFFLHRNNTRVNTVSSERD